jgi:hypothetical protein
MGIEFPVRLGPGTAYGGTFSAVENTKLDAAEIGGSGHKPIQGVDFPD